MTPPAGSSPGESPTAIEIADAVRHKRRPAVEFTQDALDHIREIAPLNAFLDDFGERALDQAHAIDTRIASGEADRLPLAGVPIAVKDNICLEWGRTTAGSRFLEDYESPFTATCVRRLLDAGAVVVGKTNLDEFGMGSSGENSAFGATTSPHGSERVPGGSSSGSAVAVASGAVPIALGTDTGGSIRQPAAFCGCVGLKPSYGRVSRYGLIAFGSSLDQAGPITRDVADATIALRLMAGEDPRDMTSSARAVPEAVPVESCRGVRVGIPRSARSAHNHPSVNDALSRAADALENDGAEIVEIDLPHQEHAIAAYYVVAPAEASSNLSRYDGVRYGRRAEGATLEAMYVRSRTEGFGPEVRRRIMLGTQVLSGGYERAMYMKALKARRLIKRDFDRAMAEDGSGCSLVLTPTTPGPAFRIGEKAGDAMAMYLQDIYTVSVNLAGLPAVSIPAGSAEDGGDELPVGVQLVGPTFGEERLLGHAQRMETLLAPD